MHQHLLTNKPKTMKTHILPLLFILFATVSSLCAQDFVYQPRNPAFGGEVFNYQWMLNSANAQNTIEDPNMTDLNDRFSRDPLQDFQDQLNRQLFNQITSAIIGNQFGQIDGIDDGTYVFGNYQVEVGTSADGISIVIVDNTTGNTTEVVVPLF